MHGAAFENHFEIVKLLIKKGGHIDAIDDVSNTMIGTDPFKCPLTLYLCRHFTFCVFFCPCIYTSSSVSYR